MNNERKPFITLGKSKFSKVANSIVLVLLILYALSKLGIFETTVSTGIDVEIPKQEINISSVSELDEALAAYQLDEEGLSKVLEKNNINADDFYQNIDVSFLKNFHTSGEFMGLFIEIRSPDGDGMEHQEAFRFIANDVQQFIRNYQKVNKSSNMDAVGASS